MTFVYIFAGILVIILLVLTIEYSILIPPRKGLAVLMYHKVSNHVANGLTIPVSMLEKQFSYIKSKKFNVLTFAEIEMIRRENNKLPRKPLVITFDDAYQNYHDLVLPLLEKYNLKATVFVPVAYMGKSNIWDKGNDPLMTPESLKNISSGARTEIGIHSFLHRSYSELASEEIKEDLENCFNSLKYYKIPFVRVLAYPYGAFPRKDKVQKEEMKEIFRETGITLALRIGNRINRWPLKDPYEVKRIDIRGTDNFFTFRTKLRKGRRKLFS